MNIEELKQSIITSITKTTNYDLLELIQRFVKKLLD